MEGIKFEIEISEETAQKLLGRDFDLESLDGFSFDENGLTLEISTGYTDSDLTIEGEISYRMLKNGASKAQATWMALGKELAELEDDSGGKLAAVFAPKGKASKKRQNEDEDDD